MVNESVEFLKFQKLIDAELALGEKCQSLMLDASKKQKVQVSMQIELSRKRLMALVQEYFDLPSIRRSQASSLSGHSDETNPNPPSTPPKENNNPLLDRIHRNSMHSYSTSQLAPSSCDSQPSQRKLSMINLLLSPRKTLRASRQQSFRVNRESNDIDAFQTLQQDRDNLLDQLESESKKNSAQYQIIESQNNKNEALLEIIAKLNDEKSVDKLEVSLVKANTIKTHRTSDQGSIELATSRQDVQFLSERIKDLEQMLRAMNMDRNALSFAEKFTRLRLRIDQLEKYKNEPKKNTNFTLVYSNILTQLKQLEATLLLQQHESQANEESNHAEIDMLRAEREIKSGTIEDLKETNILLAEKIESVESQFVSLQKADGLFESIQQNLKDTLLENESLQATIKSKDLLLKKHDEQSQVHTSDQASLNTDNIMLQASSSLLKQQINQLKNDLYRESQSKEHTLKLNVIQEEKIGALDAKLADLHIHLRESVGLLDGQIIQKDKSIADLTHELTNKALPDPTMINKEDLQIELDSQSNILKSKDLAYIALESEHDRLKESLSSMTLNMQTNTIEEESKRATYLRQESELQEIKSQSESYIHQLLSQEKIHLETIAHLGIQQNEITAKNKGLSSINASQDVSIQALLRKIGDEDKNGTMRSMYESKINQLSSELTTMKQRNAKVMGGLKSVYDAKKEISGTLEMLGGIKSSDSDGETDQVLGQLDDLRVKISIVGNDMKAKVDVLFAEYNGILKSIESV